MTDAPGGATPASGATEGTTVRRDLRQALLEAAERVFAASGFAAASVDDVIRAAETSRATFYRYFPSKEALFAELSGDCFREMRDLVRQLGPASLPEVLGRYRALHEQRRGVIRAWTERSGPAGSETRDSGRRALSTLVAETAGALGPPGGGTGHGGTTTSPVDARAALLFTTIERSTAYLTSPTSAIPAGRLDPTLTEMVRRAYFS